MKVTEIQPYPYVNYSRAANEDIRNKYYLFCGTHKPYGGWEDFKGNFSTLDDALIYLRKNIEPDERNWYHVVNIETQNIIKEFPEGRMRENK